MKRVLMICLAVSLILTLSGCGDEDSLRYYREEYDKAMGYRDDGTSSSQVLTAEVPTEVPAEEPSAEAPAEMPAGDGEVTEAPIPEESPAGEAPSSTPPAPPEGSDQPAPAEGGENPDPSSQETPPAPPEGSSDPGTGNNPSDPGTGSSETTQTTSQASAAGNTNTESVPESGDTSDSEEENVKKFHVGERWTVDGQWSLVINAALPTEIRDEASPENPQAVYFIDYTYKNEGYTDPNDPEAGLIFWLDEDVTDSAGDAGYSYNLDIPYDPQEVPVGESCNAQVCVAVNHAGTFEITVGTYDSSDNYQEAIFVVDV